MCEPFAMSARHPATVEMSLEAFSRHGGLAGPHKDGWGIAGYDAGDVRLVKETFPAADAACARYIEQHRFASPLVVGHIRKATHGEAALRNRRPFICELGGAWHVFAWHGRAYAGADLPP